MSTVLPKKHALNLSHALLAVPVLLLDLEAHAQSDSVHTVHTSTFEPVTVEGNPLTKNLPWSSETTRTDLDSMQIMNWAEFGRRTEPGVSFNQASQSINVRGLDQNRVLTKIDGIRQSWLNDVARGVRGGLNTVDFNSLLTIDIVRGADSSTAGSGALGGVVDVRTLSPADLLPGGKTFGALLKGGYSSVDHSWSGSVGVAGQVAPHTQILLLAGLQDGHESANMGKTDTFGPSRTQPDPSHGIQENYQLKLLQKFEGGHSLGLSGAYFEREDSSQNYSASPYIYKPGQSTLKNTSQRQSLALDYAWVSDHTNSLVDSIDAKVFTQRVNLGSNLSAERRMTPVGSYTRNDSIQEQTYGIHSTATKAFAGDISQHWLVGAEWYGNTNEQSSTGKDNCPARFSPYSPCKFLRTNQSEMPKVEGSQWGLWAENTLGFANNIFKLTPAVRYDAYQQRPQSSDSFSKNAVAGQLAPVASGSAVSPKLLASWAPSKYVSLFAQYAFGFNAPSASQLYSRYGSPGTYLISGNPDLKPETSRGWELGTRIGDQQLNGSLTYFDNSYQNFIEAVNRPGNAQYPYYIQSYENLESVRIYGVEAKAEWRFAKGWRAFSSLAWSSGQNEKTRQPLNSVAPLTAIAGLGYSQEQWGVQGQVTAAAARQDVTYPETSKQVKYADFQAPGYGVADLTAYWTPPSIQGLRIQTGLFNVFNQTYWNALNVPTAGAVEIPRATDFYTSPGRSVQLSMTYQY
jgi:hemoglobin/transferrin/lactoferrin receptor protein